MPGPRPSLPGQRSDFVNSEKRLVIVKDVGEQHCIEDVGYVPSAADYLAELDPQPWMSGRAGHAPPSARRLAAKRGRTLHAGDVLQAKAVVK